VTVAYPNGVLTALYHIAVAKGFFQQEGIEIVPYPSVYAKAAVEAVIAGKADLAFAADTPFVLATLAGEKLYILAVVATTERYNAIVARTDRGISSPRNLKGKRIGAALGTTAHFFLESFLSAQGMGMNEVVVVDIKPGEEARKAIAEGTIDAVSYWSYFAKQMVLQLGEKGAIFYDDSLYSDTGIITCRQDYAKAHPEAIRKVLGALVRAADLATGYPQESKRIVAEGAKAERTLVEGEWDAANFEVGIGQALMVNLEDQTRWAQKSGLAAGTTMPNYLDYIYIDGLQSVRPGAVRIIR
jgi:NitT/TauT family transport system substrate-binding protein